MNSISSSLSRMNISRFRGLRAFSCDGLCGVTIIGGRNNSGKTSLLEAIYMLHKGAIASSLAELNELRRVTASWEDFALAFYDGDYSTPIKITGEFSDATKKEVVVSLVDREKIVYTGDKDKDARLSKEIHVDETISEPTNDKPKTVKSKFYYELKSDPPRPGGLAQDSWVLYNARKNTRNTVYLTASIQRDVCIQYLRETLDQKQGAAILQAMQRVDPRIQNLAVNGQVKADVKGIGHLLPVQLLGDGMQKIVNVLSAIYHCRGGGCVLIDEIDNGLHYSAYLPLMRSAVRFAMENQVQLFMTTHNLEFIQQMSGDDELKRLLSNEESFAYLNLVRPSEGDLDCVHYTFAQLADAIDSGLEVR